MKGKLINVSVLIFLLLITSFLSAKTYSLLFSETKNDVNLTLAKFNVNLNDFNLNETAEITHSDIQWNNENANPLKVAPGSDGVLNLKLEPKEIDVALKYKVSFVDNNIDSEKILTVTNLYVNEEEKQITDNSFEDIITLEQLSNNLIYNIKLKVKWINQDSNDLEDTKIGLEEKTPSFMDLKLNVSQYNG